LENTYLNDLDLLGDFKRVDSMATAAVSLQSRMLTRICKPAPLLAAALATSVLFAGRIGAETYGRDYYAAASSRAATTDLRNVERYHYRPALEKMQKRQYHYAFSDIEFVLKYFPNHPGALDLMGDWGVATKRADLAEEHFKTAIALYPQHDDTHTIYGVFLEKLGRVDEAIAQYKKALEINPNSPFAHYNLGLVYVARKEYTQANVHAQKAYSLGLTFPALRAKLEAAGAWRPL
jgi:tetratricopeptide (TPR) repeat protein